MNATRIICGLGLLGAALSPAALAATCTFAVASGSWDAPASWSGCSAGNGLPAGTPGPGDRALIANATVSFGTDQETVRELRIEAGAVLMSGASGAARLRVEENLELAGGRVQGAAGGRNFWLETGPAAQALLSVSSTWGSFVRVVNRGQWRQAASADNRLTVGGNSRFDNEPGARWEIQAPGRLEMDAASSGRLQVLNRGEFKLIGSGTVTLQGKAAFESLDFDANRGELIIEGASAVFAPHVRLNLGASQFAQLSAGPTSLLMRQGSLSLGGPAELLEIPAQALLAGSGVFDARLRLLGRLSPGTDVAAGLLQFSGAIDYSLGRLEFDLFGAEPAQRDRLHSQAAVDSFFGQAEGDGRFVLRFANGYAPSAGEQIDLFTYANSTQLMRAVHLLEHNAALPLATRFDATALRLFVAPLLQWGDAEILEGADGEHPLSFPLSLSAPATQASEIGFETAAGTADSFDYNGRTGTQNIASGQQAQPISVSVVGDTTVEGDEDFQLVLPRRQLRNLALPSGFAGSPRLIGTILTDELPSSREYLIVGKDATTRRARRYLKDGSFIDAWNTAAEVSTGMCRGIDGRIYATRFSPESGNAGLARMSRHGAVSAREFGGNFSPAAEFHAESCVVDGSGRVLVGHATDASVGGAARIARLLPNGELDRYFTVPIGPRGSDWIELDPNGCTLYYTSEGSRVLRYDLCTDGPMSDLVEGLGAPCFAVRRRANAELIVACRHAVHRISAAGSVLATYTREQIGEPDAQQGLFALDLDPDGSSFWVGAGASGNVYRVDIATGAVLNQFATGPGGVAGLLALPSTVPAGSALFSDGFEE